MPQHFPRERMLGERIWLRRQELRDAREVYRVIDGDRPHLRRFLPWVVGIHSFSHQEDYIRLARAQWEERRIFDYGIYLRGDDVFIGSVGAHHIDWAARRCELGYWIASAFEGLGLVSEAVGLLEQELFGLGLAHFEIHCEPTNRRSAAVPQRCGYELAGLRRESEGRGQVERPMMIWVKEGRGKAA